jgi:hypothetical protein
VSIVKRDGVGLRRDFREEDRCDEVGVLNRLVGSDTELADELRDLVVTRSHELSMAIRTTKTIGSTMPAEAATSMKVVPLIDSIRFLPARGRAARIRADSRQVIT